MLIDLEALVPLLMTRPFDFIQPLLWAQCFYVYALVSRKSHWKAVLGYSVLLLVVDLLSCQENMSVTIQLSVFKLAQMNFYMEFLPQKPINHSKKVKA